MENGWLDAVPGSIDKRPVIRTQIRENDRQEKKEVKGRSKAKGQNEMDETRRLETKAHVAVDQHDAVPVRGKQSIPSDAITQSTIDEDKQTSFTNRRSCRRNRDTRKSEHLEARGTESEHAAEIERLEARLAKVDGLLKEKTWMIGSMEEAGKRQHQTYHDLLARNRQQEDELRLLTEDLHRTRKVQQQTNQLLQNRTEELSNAEKFLGKADSISAVEVARLVGFLNAEIAQATSFILDSLTNRKSFDATNEVMQVLWPLLDGIHSWLGPILSHHLWRRLVNPGHTFDPLPAQIALQTGLVNACSKLINGWYPPFAPDVTLLEHIYYNMGASAGQAVAGKWRALAQTYIENQGHELEVRSANEQSLRQDLRVLFALVTGSLLGGDSITQQYDEKIDEITRKALELHKIIRRSTTSMELSTYTFSCNTKFDPNYMDDEEGNGQSGSTSESRVLCTLEMGLQYRKVVQLNEQGGFREEFGVVLKPKVVLADVLNLEGP